MVPAKAKAELLVKDQFKACPKLITDRILVFNIVISAVNT
jgi:hypothetical protein